MPRLLPFAIAIFMLTPFLLWAGFYAAGMRSGVEAWQSPIGWVLLATSLPLAGLFWIQNLRQLGNSMGEASRLGLAARLAGLLPFAMLAIGLSGSAWLWWSGEGLALAVIALLATLVLSVLTRFAAEAAVEPGFTPAPVALDQRAEDELGRGILLFFANVAMALALLAYYVTPQVLLWALAALVPIAFALMMRLAWWATEGGQAAAPPAAPPAAPLAPPAEPLRRAA
ncbi:hypothetical protein KTR66_05975 [Roseococcus sp. SDR]|uniref:hypothetical protein n=1 Tax=Roseococcus sp. SDR TaxID=2835532 RepID=UPI001BCE3BCA|nr:hypothetical protein [Roseococcus sp. SDR]MBS7789531.1 hypothetical protein [Roseococcus sp. SDR]MBV1844845.1 hypothetical protein [Roseococcus sp. SDR]